MKYAIVGCERTEASPNLRGSCPACAKEMISKCGKILVWHWAHKPSRHCDPWWEGETAWHREWKSCFAPEQQEVIQTDPQTGEVHIADVKTRDGIVIEFQNSPLDLEEMRSRERFYGRMVWVVNGQKFKDQFHVLTRLPPPDSDLARRLIILRPPRYPTDPTHPRYRFTNKPYFLTDKNATHFNTGDGVQVTFFETATVVSTEFNQRTGIKTRFADVEAMDEIDQFYDGHHYLEWIRPRDVWLSATAPVLIDLGDGILYHIERFKDHHLCVRAYSKSTFLAAHGAVTVPPAV